MFVPEERGFGIDAVTRWGNNPASIKPSGFDYSSEDRPKHEIIVAVRQLLPMSLEYSRDMRSPSGNRPNRVIKKCSKAYDYALINSLPQLIADRCERCRIHKVKCSGSQPCTRCDRKKERCHFVFEEERISIPKRYGWCWVNRPISNRRILNSYLQRLLSRSELPRTSVLSANELRTIDPHTDRLGNENSHNPDESMEAALEERQDMVGVVGQDRQSLLSPAGLTQADAPDRRSEDETLAENIGSATTMVEPVFQQNPLGDNDHTFAPALGKYCQLSQTTKRMQ